MTTARAAVITGANGGIGATLCREFSAGGWYVIATDRGASGPGHHDAYLQMDLERFSADESWRAEMLSRLRAACAGHRIGALVNNAALQVLGEIEKLTTAQWHSTLNVNLLAPFLLIQGMLPDLEKGRGSVVNIASIHARLTKRRFTAYATSKAALIGMTQALAVELGERVRINAIAPGAIETEMLVSGFSSRPDALAELAALHPVRRIGQPEEVAAAALFLASDQCRFITGAVLEIDGGIGHRLHDPA